MGNLAAVCRSADAFACGAVYAIRNNEKDRYKQSRKTSGQAMHDARFYFSLLPILYK
jgi:tRNA G18 (ribose-2'-O)-methylase SpoU